MAIWLLGLYEKQDRATEIVRLGRWHAENAMAQLYEIVFDGNNPTDAYCKWYNIHI